MRQVDVRVPRFSCRLFERDHVLGGVGTAMTTTLAKSTGLIQSQAVKAVATKITLRNCSLLKGSWIQISTGDVTNLPLRWSTVVYVKDWSREIRDSSQHQHVRIFLRTDYFESW